MTSSSHWSRHMYRLFTLVCLVSLASPQRSVADESAAPEDMAFFESHIRPLLHSRCVKCHGEDQQKGELRLDSIDGILTGGASGPAIVPGDPARSLMMEAVRYESFEMPPGKPLSKRQITQLEQWIRDGAVWPRINGESVRLNGTAFTAEERQFWSVIPVADTAVPNVDLKVDGQDWQHNEVDQFIAERLKAAELRPAPRASDQQLVRRLYFDLLGVPPSPDEIDSFAQEADAGRWPRLVDRLLEDSRYGERLGRYWLDIVRYAESDGFRADFYRENAWRYRDYVINAFNDDKPYDQFVMEQLAGDELAPQRAESLVATGFLRTYLYEYNQRDARTQWQDILNQVTDVTGEVFLGYGVGCARCHDHKFDPILQKDYYRLQACFGSMIPRDDIPAADLVDRRQYDENHAMWLQKAAEVRAELHRIREPYLKKAAVGAVTKFPEDIQAIMAIPAEIRGPLEMQLADLVERQIVYDQDRIKYRDEDVKRIETLEKQLLELAGTEPAGLPGAITVFDAGHDAQPIHLGGDPKRPAVAPGGLSIIDARPFDVVPTATSTGQRTALARWIASPDNPLTARVIVNRIWQHHFGRGLVDTASDFGTLGDRPSHPQLLDWLSAEFVRNGWSLKWLHRKILNSTTWQMSSFHPDASAAEATDPGNRLRWRFDVQRLTAEQIRDAMLTVSGELKSERGGPSVDYDSLRRSVYLKVIRNKPEPLLRSLDGLDGLNSVAKRSTTTTPTQALNLINGEWVRQRAAAMAARVLDQTGESDTDAAAETAFLIALGRKIDPAEMPVAANLINDTIAQSESELPPTQRWGSLGKEFGRALNVSAEKAVGPVSTSDPSLKVASPFTFIGLARLESLYPDATVRTIVSQWNSNSKIPGWAIGVTSTRSSYQPRNFILQVVGEAGYEVVASNLRPELGVAYALAVAVNATETGQGRALFVLKSLSGKEPLQHAEIPFRSSVGITGKFPLILGGRARQEQHRWDGQLDQAIIVPDALTLDEITRLFDDDISTESVAAHRPSAAWTFDSTEEPFADTSGHGHSLSAGDDVSENPVEAAVAELCHVLLNSNEFVYVD